MPVWIRNIQRCVPLNVNWLKFIGEFILNVTGAGRFEVSLVCCGSKKVRYLNKTYRGQDEETDVLSFAYHEGLTPGVLPAPDREDDYNLGDIILALPVIRADAEEDGASLQQRLPVIVTHGYCHLMGYSHHSRSEWMKMYSREETILKSYNLAFGEKLKPLTQNMIE